MAENGFRRGQRRGVACGVRHTCREGYPPGVESNSRRREIDVICKEEACDRRAHSRGWCTTHYRRYRTGRPMDAPIRRYVQNEQGVGGEPVPGPSITIRRKRERPFAEEYALLAELGLYPKRRRQSSSSQN